MQAHKFQRKPFRIECGCQTTGCNLSYQDMKKDETLTVEGMIRVFEQHYKVTLKLCAACACTHLSVASPLIDTGYSI